LLAASWLCWPYCAWPCLSSAVITLRSKAGTLSVVQEVLYLGFTASTSDTSKHRGWSYCQPV
jgi:hypothetical protein